MHGHLNVKLPHICPAEVLVQVSLVLRRPQSNTPLTRNYTYNFMMSANLRLCCQIVSPEYSVNPLNTELNPICQ